MFDLLVGTAFASEAAPQPSILEVAGLPLAMLMIMYFLVIRPQQKKMKEQQSLIEGLKAGDEVVTSGGIIGKVKSVADNFVTLEVGSNTFLKVIKSNISSSTKVKAK